MPIEQAVEGIVMRRSSLSGEVGIDPPKGCGDDSGRSVLVPASPTSPRGSSPHPVEIPASVAALKHDLAREVAAAVPGLHKPLSLAGTVRRRRRPDAVVAWLASAIAFARGRPAAALVP